MASWIILRPSISRRPLTHAADDAVLQAVRIAHHDDAARPAASASLSPSSSAGRSLRSTCTIARSSARSEAWMAFTVSDLAVGGLHRNRPGLADDVQVRGDQPALVDDEARAQPLLLAVAAGVRDDHDRIADLGRQFLDRRGRDNGSAIGLAVLSRQNVEPAQAAMRPIQHAQVNSSHTQLISHPPGRSRTRCLRHYCSMWPKMPSDSPAVQGCHSALASRAPRDFTAATLPAILRRGSDRPSSAACFCLKDHRL